MVYQPQILILDEATSSVDTETEEMIQLAMERIMKGRTSVVIAHRLSTIQNADEILVVDLGEIKERGTHDSLLEAKGLYANLHEIQYQTRWSEFLKFKNLRKGNACSQQGNVIVVAFWSCKKLQSV